MTPQKIKKIFQRLQKESPLPKIELHYHTPFELLVAVILSAQATDKSVNKAADELFKVANTPKKILALGIDGFKKYVKSIGLYNSKSKNILSSCQILVDQHHSEIPHDRESLEQLPGVGRKSANVILNTAFGEPVIAVDTHVFRVANRTKIAEGKTVIDVENQLNKVVPNEFKMNASHWLVLHGRYVCIARKPRCSACLIQDLCEYELKAVSNSSS